MNFDYPTAVRFRCIKCGICCGDTKEKSRHILLLKTEAEQIAKATFQSISEFAVKIKYKAPYSYEMKKAETGKCAFLKNNLCVIYAVRPLVCRFYPFELKSAHGGKYVFLYTTECLGINTGAILSKSYFRSLFRLAHTRTLQAAEAKSES